MSRFLLGLTGGLASGKSTVGRWLAEAGFEMVDADRVVAELYAPGGRGAAAVRELFGGEALTPEGAVDRPRVAEIVFADDEARRSLEHAVHPLVRQHFAEIAGAAEGIVVYEATLLVESGHCEVFDLVVSVEAPEEKRLEWAVARGMDRESAAARLAAQGDGEKRRSGADHILWNDGTLDDLRKKVDELITELSTSGAP
ncbi:MAG: dephospho-CoA kinase [bacterium]|nr:dephospho-CoA kinase [bacterium]